MALYSMIAKVDRSMIRFTPFHPRAIRKSKIRHSSRKKITMAIQFRGSLAFREAHQTQKKLFQVIRVEQECSHKTWICQLINKFSQHKCPFLFHPFHLNLSTQMTISISLSNLPKKNSIARVQEEA